MTTAYERIRDALESRGAAKETGTAKLVAQCPAHDDRNPSLSVTGIEGSALLYCHAGCATTDVLAALDMGAADLFDNRREATYTYPGGRKVHRKADKQFPQSGNKDDRSLFRADRLGEARHVLVVEGEKDVLAAESIGAVAVCSAMGAGKAHKADWTPLRGRYVTVVADNDDAGRKHAAQVAELVTAAGAVKVQIVRSAVGKDLADHIAAGKSLDELVEEQPTEEPEATTWEAFDLGPWLDGTHVSPQPSVGIRRTDGQQLLYPGREHVVFGETECGKSWFALECVAREIRMGRDVVYIHYEEGDPGSTIERLMLLCVTPAQMVKHLRFVAPARPVRGPWLTPLLDPPPALVVHDGVNEAMSLHGDDANATDGAATFRRTIIKPFLAAGVTSLACDHVIKNSDSRGRYAIGSVHKVNAIDGAAFLMENIEPFGRGLRGASAIYVTKDRPGQLRAQGRPAPGVAGKTLMGVLSVDATNTTEDFLAFHAPKDREPDTDAAGPTLADEVYQVLLAMPDHTAKSGRAVRAAMRDAGLKFSTEGAISACDDLVFQGRAVEIRGNGQAVGYRAIPADSTVPDESPVHGVPETVPFTVPLIESGTVERYPVSVPRNGPEQSGTVEEEADSPVHCQHCGVRLPAYRTEQIAARCCTKAACVAASKAVSA